MSGEAIVHAADVVADIEEDMINVKEVCLSSERSMSEHIRKR